MRAVRPMMISWRRILRRRIATRSPMANAAVLMIDETRMKVRRVITWSIKVE